MAYTRKDTPFCLRNPSNPYCTDETLNNPYTPEGFKRVIEFWAKRRPGIDIGPGPGTGRSRARTARTLRTRQQRTSRKWYGYGR